MNPKHRVILIIAVVIALLILRQLTLPPPTVPGPVAPRPTMSPAMRGLEDPIDLNARPVLPPPPPEPTPVLPFESIPLTPEL